MHSSLLRRAASLRHRLVPLEDRLLGMRIVQNALGMSSWRRLLARHAAAVRRAKPAIDAARATRRRLPAPTAVIAAAYVAAAALVPLSAQLG